MVQILSNFYFTKHAQERMQQRGIKNSAVNTILTYADREIKMNDNKIAISITKKHLKTLVQEKKICGDLIDKINGVCIIIANDNYPVECKETIVTVIRTFGNDTRFYRKRNFRNKKKHKRFIC